jgi:transposase
VNSNSSDCAPVFVAAIGLDWGDQSHALALHDPATGQIEAFTLTHSAERLHQWLDQLEIRFGGRPIALAIEGTRGAIFPVLLARPWLHLFAVHPVTSARYRTAFTPSGAKDDLPDAQVLLELLLRHRDKLTPLTLTDAVTRQLTGLCEARRDLVDRRTQLLNQLSACLKKFYPQALALAGDNLASPLALAFLTKWPDLITLKTARPATVKAFYYTHNVRRPQTVQARLECIAQARALTTDEAVVGVAVRQLNVLVEQLRVVQKHVAGFDTAIAKAFAAHPEAALFRDLPGAGAVLAPRLLVAFGTERDRYPDPGSLQKYAGLAPVREKSGGALWTHWRWHAPTFLRQSFMEWAGQTVVYCPWAKAYYERMKAKDKGHWAILRALAFKWVRLLWKCWQDRTPYDEARYLKQLAHRRSPLAQALPQTQPALP